MTKGGPQQVKALWEDKESAWRQWRPLWDGSRTKKRKVLPEQAGACETWRQPSVYR